MKIKHIITAILLIVSTTAFAQPKDTTKKTYKLDLSKPIKLDIILSAQQLNDFLLYLQRGPGISKAEDLSGAQISAIQDNTNAVSKLLYDQFNKFLVEDKAKFTSDTLKTNKRKPW